MDKLFETLAKEVPNNSFILDIGINNWKLTKRFIEELKPSFLKGIESESRQSFQCVMQHADNVELLYDQPIETFEDKRKYDLVIMFKTLHYTSFPEPAEAIPLAKKFLNRNGLLLLGLALDANTEEGDRRMLDLQDVKDQLRAHNFMPMFDKKVDDPYNPDYYNTHILLYGLL